MTRSDPGVWEQLLRPNGREDGDGGVAVDALTVQFGGVTAIDGLSHVVEAHEFLAVVGQNGAGKTTLLNALSGLVRPTRGSVLLDGLDITSFTSAKIAALGVGRSFQDPKLLDTASVLENLLLGEQLNQPYGLFAQLFLPARVAKSERVAAERALAILDAVNLRHLASERAGELPFGLRKLVDLLRAVMGVRSLLLLDEPSSGLDTGEQEVVRFVLGAIKETRAVTAVIVEHHWDVVRSTTDRVLVLENGKYLMSGPPAEVLDSESFRSALVGRRREVPDKAGI